LTKSIIYNNYKTILTSVAYSVLPPLTTITLECFLPRADNTVTLYVGIQCNSIVRPRQEYSVTVLSALGRKHSSVMVVKGGSTEYATLVSIVL
jgi:hypothetical protein